MRTIQKTVITPICGLCNRMRCILSGIQAAREVGSREIIVNWQKTKDCGALFTDLFCPIPDSSIHLVQNNAFFKISLWKKNLHYPKILRYICGWHQKYNHNRKYGNILPDILGHRRTYLQSFHSMHAHYAVNQVFVPRPELMVHIDEISSLFQQTTYGLHIRRTDHIKAIDRSPLDKFLRLVRQKIKSEDAFFYLATDDADVKSFFRKEFPGRIITIDTPLDRDSCEGVQGALIDLWILSRTACIFGSYGSSYSEMASEIGNKKLITIE